MVSRSRSRSYSRNSDGGRGGSYRRKRSYSRDDGRSRSPNKSSRFAGRRPPDVEGMVSLKVDNITYRTTAGELYKIFQKYGEIGDIYLPRDLRSGQSRGFAFVRYYKKRHAEKALRDMHDEYLDKRRIRVSYAKYSRPSTGEIRAKYGGSRSNSRSRERSRYRSRSDSRSRSRSSQRRRKSRSRSAEDRKKSVDRDHSVSREASPKNSKDRSRSNSSHPRSNSGSPARLKDSRRSESNHRSRSSSRNTQEGTHSPN